MKFYRVGDRADEIRTIQQILIKQGFPIAGLVPGLFTGDMESAVKYFQITHIGPDGKPLDADGVIGPLTWWALENPSGESQRNHLDPRIPHGLTPMRRATLTEALGEWLKGVREVPDGSNWGPEIEKYGGRPGWAWCCLFTTWNWRQAGVVKIKEPSTWNLLQIAKREGWFFPLGSPDPRAIIPGNALIWQHGNRTGHIALICRVSENSDKGLKPLVFNTIGGNEGNRVKFGIRDARSRDLVGFINPFPESEQPRDFERGIVTTSQKVENLSTR